jgi:hypothetical protein
VADLSITSTLVTQVDGGVIDGTAGETITAGQAVYLDTTTGKFKKATANATSVVLLATVAGIALNGAALDQPLRVQASGTIVIGGTVVVGKTYVLSATAGAICPDADITTSLYYKTILGVGTTAARIALNINNSGAQIP